jgi:hypothetical protein
MDRRPLDKPARRQIKRQLDAALRRFPAVWNGPLQSPMRRYVQDLVPLEYSIEWLTCAFASMRDAMLVSLPGAVEDRLRGYVPGAQSGRPGVPR